jgi:hypothetical protein
MVSRFYFCGTCSKITKPTCCIVQVYFWNISDILEDYLILQKISSIKKPVNHLKKTLLHFPFLRSFLCTTGNLNPLISFYCDIRKSDCPHIIPNAQLGTN